MNSNSLRQIELVEGPTKNAWLTIIKGSNEGEIGVFCLFENRFFLSSSIEPTLCYLAQEFPKERSSTSFQWTLSATEGRLSFTIETRRSISCRLYTFLEHNTQSRSHHCAEGEFTCHLESKDVGKLSGEATRASFHHF